MYIYTHITDTQQTSCPVHEKLGYTRSPSFEICRKHHKLPIAYAGTETPLTILH